MKRYIARTVVRRIVWIVTGLAVYALLSFLGVGVGEAHAQTVDGCTRDQPTAWSWTCGDNGQANAQVSGVTRWDDSICPPGQPPQRAVFDDAAGKRYVKRLQCGQAPTGLNDGLGEAVARYTGSCSARDPLTQNTWFNVPDDESLCKEGCVYHGQGACLSGLYIDGVIASTCSGGWNPTGAVCSAGLGGFPSTPPSNAPPDSDGDGTSDGNDSSPNNPGQGGGGADGGSDEDGNCGGEGQPVCGEPGSGSGNGNTSGGGGNCGSPPSSSGDPILAQIAYQTWATRCAVEKQGTGTGPGTGEQPAWTKVDGMTQNPGEGSSPDDTDVIRDGGVIDGSNLDFSGFSGGSCIGIPGGGGSALTQGFVSVLASPPPQWCEFIDMVKALFILFATIATTFWLVRN